MCRKHTSVDRSRDSLGMFFAGITKTQAHVCSLHVSSPKARWHRHFVTHRWKQTALLAVLSQQWREKLVHTHTHTIFIYSLILIIMCKKHDTISTLSFCASCQETLLVKSLLYQKQRWVHWESAVERKFTNPRPFGGERAGEEENEIFFGWLIIDWVLEWMSSK